MPELLTRRLLELLPWLLFLLLAGACTRPNPDFCCTSDAECASLGVSELRTCGGGKVCDSNVCIEAQCAGDSDCIGAPGGEVCADDHMCVGCESNADCDEEAPICDLAKRACAPCRDDADCASGVCLAADGVCAKASQIFYVRTEGNDGLGCTQSVPCRNFNAALVNVTATRRVIRILGRDYPTSDGIVISTQNVYIDAENTEITRTSAGPIFTFSGTSTATLEGVKLNVAGRTGVSVTSPLTTRFSQLEAIGTQFENAIYLEAGTTHISDSKFFNSWVLCGSANLELETSSFQNGAVDGGQECSGEIRRSQFSNTRVTVSGGLVFQNNLVTSTSPTCTNDFSGGPISQIDFNTWVCRHNPPISTPFEGRAFSCGLDDRPTGNLVAWDSVEPASGCTLRHSLLPSFATPLPGENNRYTDMANVFIDYLGGDYHLSADSPAKGAAEQKSNVTIDFEGNPRPNPRGSAPDIGAFEAP